LFGYFCFKNPRQVLQISSSIKSPQRIHFVFMIVLDRLIIKELGEIFWAKNRAKFFSDLF